MPCIQIKTNVKVEEGKSREIKSSLGSAIACLPGKSEEWLMVVIEDDCQMYFKGETGRPFAIVEVKFLGTSVDKDGAREMTSKVTKVMETTLGVSPDEMYIKYEALPDWGWNGTNF